jgi:hypothetical protein
MSFHFQGIGSKIKQYKFNRKSRPIGTVLDALEESYEQAIADNPNNKTTRLLNGCTLVKVAMIYS